MSNNAAVPEDGGEIGRAQALQARAAKVPLTKHMNPVLLKPESDVGSQVVVQGKVLTRATARDYRKLKPQLMQAVSQSFELLSEEADLLIVEGAGSPAEVNLRAGDIANMGFANAARVPVVLVGDIDRGGVIAAVVGTHALLPEEDAQWVRGYAINKFRGDPSLFTPALDIIQDHTGWPSFGVVPFWPGARGLPAEDGVALDDAHRSAGQTGQVKVVIPRLSRIANFDDFDPLIAEPDLSVRFLDPGQALPGDTDWVILPGSKSTIGDLAFLRAQGWDQDILAHHRRGGAVTGICGGYQMLGRTIADPDGLEGPASTVAGLGLLDVETVMRGDKTLTQVTAESVEGVPLSGYEIHLGVTQGPDCARPWMRLAGQDHGAVSADGRVRGAYLHGLFAADGFRHGEMARLGAQAGLADYESRIDHLLDELADHMETHLDLDALYAIAKERQ
jgi:adenosylcobyric acid synthase